MPSLGPAPNAVPIRESNHARHALARRGAPTALFARRIGKAEYVVVAERRPTTCTIAFKTTPKRPIHSTKNQP